MTSLIHYNQNIRPCIVWTTDGALNKLQMNYSILGFQIYDSEEYYLLGCDAV
jgi:hypothetical protein